MLLNRSGRDSSVGIETGHGLDGPGIESQWGARFSAPVQTDHGGPPSLLYKGYRIFPGVKRPGRVADLPPHLQCRGLKLGRAIPLPTLRALVACYIYLYLLPNLNSALHPCKSLAWRSGRLNSMGKRPCNPLGGRLIETKRRKSLQVLSLPGIEPTFLNIRARGQVTELYSTGSMS